MEKYISILLFVWPWANLNGANIINIRVIIGWAFTYLAFLRSTRMVRLPLACSLVLASAAALQAPLLHLNAPPESSLFSSEFDDYIKSVMSEWAIQVRTLSQR